jgi:hypothetical protein
VTSSSPREVSVDDAELVEAIHRHRLVPFARQVSAVTPAPFWADTALATCARIGEQCRHDRDTVVAAVRRGGVDVWCTDDTGAQQRHTINLRARDHAAADRAADLLVGEGFERWDNWTGGAQRSFERFADHLTVARAGAATTVVVIRWADRARRSVFRRVVTPTAGDWHMVELPGSLWPLYSAVRPVRLMSERLGFRHRHDDGLGPFLSTPESLVDLLLSFGDVGPEDCVVDIGCGDGRIPVAAAKRRGCRSIGVERSPALVQAARQRAVNEGVADRVEIVEGDGRSADLRGATVVFMFLPVDVVGDLLASTRQRLPRGARIIAHEQTRLPASIDPAPDSSVALISESGVTVAHRWTVD